MQATFHLRSLAALAAFVLLAGCQKADPAAAAHAQDAQISAALDAANRQLADGQTTGAITALQNLRSTYPDRYDVVEALAYAQAHAGQLPEAAALFATAASADPSRRALFIYAAGIESNAGDHAGATREYRAYLAYFPHDAPAWRSLARELRTANQAQPALDAYLESLRWSADNKPPAPDALTIGQLFLQLGNDVQAATWFHETLQLQPDDATAAQARLGLLALAVQKQDWAAADKLFTDLDATASGHAALAASPLDPTREQLRQWRAAQADVEKTQAAANANAAQRAATLAALANGSSNTTAATSTSTELASTGSPPAASAKEGPANLSSNTTTASLSANSTPPVVSFASTSSTSANTTLAASSNTTALSLSANTSSPATHDQNSATPAAPDNTNTPATEPEAHPSSPPDPLLAQAKAAADAGQFADAIRLYWKALGKDDSSPDTWLALGQVYLANKQYPDATSVAQEAIRRAAGDPVYTLFYLQVVKAGQPPEKYQAELVAAFDKFPTSADIALDLSAAYAAHGDQHDASAVLNDYLNHASPADPRRQDVSDALANLSAAPPAKSP